MASFTVISFKERTNKSSIVKLQTTTEVKNKLGTFPITRSYNLHTSSVFALNEVLEFDIKELFNVVASSFKDDDDVLQTALWLEPKE